MKKPLHPTILAILASIGFIYTFLCVYLSKNDSLSYVVKPEVITTLILIYWICQCIFLYQSWKLVQTSDLVIEKPTPGKAVGWWFIPLFNLFWIFILWRNLALHLNHLTCRKIVSVSLITIGCSLFIPGSMVNKFFLQGPFFGSAILSTSMRIKEADMVVVAIFFYLLLLAGHVIFLITNYKIYKSANVLTNVKSLNKTNVIVTSAIVVVVLCIFLLPRGERVIIEQYLQEEYQEVIEGYKEVIRISPDYADAHYYLGDAYGKSGKYKESIEAYKEAIRINPDYADAHYNLGLAYGELDMHKEAIEAFKQAIRIRPDHADAHLNLGVACHKSGMYKESIEAYKEAIRINPDDAEAHYYLGNVYGQSDMYKESIEAYKEAIRINPDYADAHYNLACSYSLLGSVNKALESLGKAIDLGYNDIKHLENDSDLDGLRDEAGYEMLINKLKR